MASTKPKKARNPLNQDMIISLYELSQKPQYANSLYHPRTFRNVMTALAQSTTHITTYAEAMKLHNVGNFFATKVASFYEDSTTKNEANDDYALGNGNPNVSGQLEEKSAGGRPIKVVIRRPNSKNREGATTGPMVMNNGEGKRSHTDEEQSVERVGKKVKRNPSAQTAVAKASSPMGSTTEDDFSVRNFLTNKSVSLPSPRKSSIPASSLSITAGAAARVANKLSKKDLEYRRVARESERLSQCHLHEYGDWAVILLLDCREQKRCKVQAKMLQFGCACELRHLPIGDMLWIARGRRTNVGAATSSSNWNASTEEANEQLNLRQRRPEEIDRNTTIEVVLGTIIERKSANDLASSLYGTRYLEQRLRLKKSALGAPQVIYLVEALSLHELPNCSAATLRYAMVSTMAELGFAIVRTKSLDETVQTLRRIHRRVTSRAFPDECKSGSESILSPEGKRLRLAPEDQRFQFPPVVAFDQERHFLYDEFKAKLDLVRERGTRSVESIFRAQLKQVDAMSNTKVHGVTAVYRTPKELFGAYCIASRLGDDNVQKLVEDVRLGSGLRMSRVGPKSSLELSYVYTQGGAIPLHTMDALISESSQRIANIAKTNGSCGSASNTANSTAAFMPIIPLTGPSLEVHRTHTFKGCALLHSVNDETVRIKPRIGTDNSNHNKVTRSSAETNRIRYKEPPVDDAAQEADFDFALSDNIEKIKGASSANFETMHSIVRNEKNLMMSQSSSESDDGCIDLIDNKDISGKARLVHQEEAENDIEVIEIE